MKPDPPVLTEGTETNPSCDYHMVISMELASNILTRVEDLARFPPGPGPPGQKSTRSDVHVIQNQKFSFMRPGQTDPGASSS